MRDSRSVERQLMTTSAQEISLPAQLLKNVAEIEQLIRENRCLPIPKTFARIWELVLGLV